MQRWASLSALPNSRSRVAKARLQPPVRLQRLFEGCRFKTHVEEFQLDGEFQQRRVVPLRDRRDFGYAPRQPIRVPEDWEGSHAARPGCCFVNAGSRWNECDRAACTVNACHVADRPIGWPRHQFAWQSFRFADAPHVTVDVTDHHQHVRWRDVAIVVDVVVGRRRRRWGGWRGIAQVGVDVTDQDQHIQSGDAVLVVDVFRQGRVVPSREKRRLGIGQKRLVFAVPDMIRGDAVESVGVIDFALEQMVGLGRVRQPELEGPAVFRDEDIVGGDTGTVLVRPVPAVVAQRLSVARLGGFESA